MFDFAWSEILLIGAVALIAIGPKDMPAAIRTVSSMIKKARRMAAEFQTHVDEMVREADLGDVRKAFNEIRNFDVAGTVQRTIDPDNAIRDTFRDDPFKPTHPVASPPEAEVSTLDEVTVQAHADHVAEEHTGEMAADVAHKTPEPEAPARPETPAYIPPHMIPPAPVAANAAVANAPAWLPPAAARRHHH
jgi:sec-independent protein translocase protein TatB